MNARAPGRRAVPPLLPVRLARRGAAAAALLLALGASLARAEESLRERVQAAMDRGDRAAAIAEIDAATAPGEAHDRRRAVEAATAAANVIGGRDGNRRAAKIVLDALERDSSDANGAWSLAMGLRKKARDTDVQTSIELLHGLVRIYPAELTFAYDLARAYRHAGLGDAALAEYERIAALAPSDRESRHRLVLLHSQRGDLARALKLCDELIGLRDLDANPDLHAHWTKTRLLLEKAHDPDAAERAAQAGRKAALRTENAATREDYLARFDEIAGSIDAERARRTRLTKLRDGLDRTLAATAALWAVVLGGGLVLLRRAGWLG